MPSNISSVTGSAAPIFPSMSASQSVMSVTNEAGSSTTQTTPTKVEKLLKAVADGDQAMVTLLQVIFIWCSSVSNGFPS